MQEYPKIQSIFKRDERTHKFLVDQWSLPEFEYLKDNLWVFTEKVDGTNIRVMWSTTEGKVTFGGKTDNAQIPGFLLNRLQDLFPAEKFYGYSSMCLYGEGYGAKIQKGGGNYISNGVDFVLFDVWIDGWWLRREAVEDISLKLGIDTVPVVGRGPIQKAINLVLGGLLSRWGDFQVEGLVLRPEVDLMTRTGQRIITKLKYKDFQKEE